MRLSKDQIRRVTSAAAALADDAPQQSLDNFFGDVLSLSALERATLIPDPDPSLDGSVNVSELTKARDAILHDDGKIPSYVVYNKPGSRTPFISGIATYLSTLAADPHSAPAFLSRLAQRDRVRTELLSFAKGHDLELLAAAIFAKACDFGEATMGSGDQGIDAIAWKELLTVESAFLGGLTGVEALPRPGHKVFFVASSKASIGAGPTGSALLNPAHIRELVGGWLIQRSTIAAWGNFGLQMLSPLQLVLVTSYRLSAESQVECNKLGIQVWGRTELVYLVCRYAPDEVFSNPGRTFSSAEFKRWWEGKKSTRQSRQAFAH